LYHVLIHIFSNYW